MPDDFPREASKVDSPARRAVAVVPHDTNELTRPCKAILVGTAGNIVGRLVDDEADVTFPVVQGYNPLRFKLIKATSTTASNIVALY